MRKWWSSWTWAEIREWINASTAVGALLIGIVSIWTTTQISGLEDYFRSEISRRNSELDNLSSRSKRLEDLAAAREHRLADLQLATETAATNSIKAQNQLLDAQTRLADLRAGEATTRAALAASKVQLAQAHIISSQQALNLEKLVRQEAAGLAHIAFISLPDESSGIRDPGQKIVELIKSSVASGGGKANPYLIVVADNLKNVCPVLWDWDSNLPVPPVQPANPKITYQVGASKRTIDHLTREAQAKWARDFDAWLKDQRAYDEKRQADSKRLFDVGGDCICRSLVTDKLSQKEICPD